MYQKRKKKSKKQGGSPPFIFFNENKNMSKSHFFLVCDFETGGLKPDKNPITEIGAVVVESTSLSVVDSFQCFVKPYDNLVIQDIVYEKTHVTPEDVENGLEMAVAFENFVDFIKKYQGNKYKGGKASLDRPTFVAHNVGFDKGFLKKFLELNKANFDDLFNAHILDTLMLSRLVYGDELNHNLADVTSRAQLDLVNHHSALDDAMATASFLVFCFKKMRSKGAVEADQEKENHRKFFQF
jgi:DNA polymerase-3 subunit alpha (Gram-positive type)